MRYHVLASDYDGTLADHGQVLQCTWNELSRLRDSGRKLVLVTGRRLEPILELISTKVSLFERIVAENGALVFDPTTGQEVLLAAPPPSEFVVRLKQAGVTRIEVGRCIVALWQNDEHAVLDTIRELSLDLQIIFNKGAVMVLPTGINKAAGLKRALDDLGLSAWNAVAVGDAENDEAMLRMCGASAAVANALDPVKQIADIVLDQPRGKGVECLVADLIDSDLQYLEARMPRVNEVSMRSPTPRGIVIGTRLDGSPLTIPEYGESVLVTGDPGGGKSRFAISILERFTPRGVQYCIVDPEGDYQDLEGCVALGNADRAPAIEEVIGVLEHPRRNCAVSLFSLDKADRPAYFDKLHRGLAELRSHTGRPHWILVDEAHYAAPRDWQPAESWSEQELHGMFFITAYHERLSHAILRQVDWVISISENPGEVVEQCCELMNEPVPKIEPPEDKQTHHALAWRRGDEKVIWFSRIAPLNATQRHVHSHYEGEMEPDLRFVFCGPKGELNLMTENIKQFIHIAEGVDEATWQFHRQQNDYSRWIDEVIKDGELADEIARIETSSGLDAKASRTSIVELLKERYEPS